MNNFRQYKYVHVEKCNCIMIKLRIDHNVYGVYYLRSAHPSTKKSHWIAQPTSHGIW